MNKSHVCRGTTGQLIGMPISRDQGEDMARDIGAYREVQLDFTDDMEVFFVLFERCPTKRSGPKIPAAIWRW